MIHDIQQCSGCGLCEAVCPVGAVRPVERERGVTYYEENAACIKCGKCRKLCPSLKEMYHPEQKSFLSVASLDGGVFKGASSGGAAYELARAFIEDGGVVYGAAWDVETQSVRHIRVTGTEELHRLSGSKYVQSEIGRGTYESVTEDLRGGRVLFIGCPCQVAAVRSLSGDADNLFTVDLVCHGVSSPKLLSEQLKMLVSEPVEKLSFRNGLRFRMRVETEHETFEKGGYDVPYYSLYLNFASLRETCYSCRYARRARVGDVTVGDYIENGKGNSLLIRNTEKGAELAEKILPRLEVTGHEIELLKINHAFNKPTVKHPQTEKFTRLYPEKGLKRAYAASFRRLAAKRKLRSLIGEGTAAKLKRIVKKGGTAK